MAFDTIDRPYAITIFVEAAVDPVGREDRTKDLTSENYNENLLSEDCARTFSSEDRDEIITCRSRPQVRTLLGPWRQNKGPVYNGDLQQSPIQPAAQVLHSPVGYGRRSKKDVNTIFFVYFCY